MKRDSSSSSESRLASRSRSRPSSRASRRRTKSRSPTSCPPSSSRKRNRSRSTTRSKLRSEVFRPHPQPTIVRGNRENPSPSKCLGVFGLNLGTTERDLYLHFRKFGKIKEVSLIVDKPTKISKGFAFIYFESVTEAEKARGAMDGMELYGHRIRVDFSVTRSPHQPTPGIYYGRPSRPDFRLHYGGHGCNEAAEAAVPRVHDDRDRYNKDRRPPPSYHDEYNHSPPCHRNHRGQRTEERDRSRGDYHRYQSLRRDYDRRRGGDRYEDRDGPSHHPSYSSWRSASPRAHRRPDY